MLHFSLAAALTLGAAPDPATDAPVVDEPEDAPVGAETEPEGPAAPEAVAGIEAPPAAIPPEPSSGMGLIIGGAAAGGVGLLANVGRIAILNSTCRDAVSVSGDQLECGVSRAYGYILFTGLAPLANGAGAVLLGIGGSKRGVYEAYKAAYQGGRQRSGAGSLAAGATMLAVGVLGYFSVRIYSILDLNGAISCGLDEQCFVRRWTTYLVGIEAMQATAVAGAGLLGYGAGLRKGSSSYVRASLQPILAPTFAGVGVRGAF